jgi:hypothetical protein
MIDLLSEILHASFYKLCKLCLRICVSDVSGLYNERGGEIKITAHAMFGQRRGEMCHTGMCDLHECFTMTSLFLLPLSGVYRLGT